MKQTKFNNNKAELKTSTEPANLINNKQSVKQRMISFCTEHRFLLICALIPAILLYLIYLCRGQYPFGNETVLALDMGGQYVFFFKGLRNAVMEGGSLLYSWSRSLGGEFMGLYAYYLASPLSYLVCLFPEDSIQEFILFLFCLKTSLCGLTMGFYLYKHSESKNKLTILAFSTLYAMSAYVIVYHSNIMWIDGVFWLPLVAYGIEQVVKYGKYKLFVVALALTLGSNYYIGYMTCIFVFLYYFFYMFAYKDNGVNNPLEEKHHFGKSIIRIGIFSALAIMIAAVIVFCAYYSLQFGKLDFDKTKWDITLRLDFFDLLFKLLPSSYDTVRIDCLPYLYCGIPAIILAPLFFCSKKFTAREKIASGAFLLVFVLSFIIEPMDLVWHGFSSPQWLNNRYSFMFCFFLLFLAFRAFEALEEIGSKAVASSAAFIFLIVILFQQFEPQYIEKLEALTYGPKDNTFIIHPFATIIMSVVLLAVYVSIIAAMRATKTRKKLVSALLVVFISLEVFLSGMCNIIDFDNDIGFSNYSDYQNFDYIFSTITDTVTNYDDSFYRMEKTYHRKVNDNMALGIRGLSNSTSTLNTSTFEFIRSLGYDHRLGSHSSQYAGGTPVTDSLLGLKYIISDRDYSAIYGDPVLTGQDYADYLDISLDDLKDTIYNKKTAADFNVYLNNFALSLAFAATDDVLNINMKEHNSYVKEDEEKYNPDGYINPFDRVNALLSAILGEEVEVYKAAERKTYNTSASTTIVCPNCIFEGTKGDFNKDSIDNKKLICPECKADATNGVTHTISSKHHKYTGQGGQITYFYNVPEGVDLYLYFPAYYNRAIKLKSQTAGFFESPTSNISLSNCNDRIVELGRSTGTEYSFTVIMEKDLFYTKEGTEYVYYIDNEVLVDVFTRIKATQMDISEDYSEDDISGTIKTTENDQLIMTTIPYDEGWQVYVDGEKVEILEAADALIAFYIDDAGNHDVRFVYRSNSFVFGLIITCIGIASFVCIIVFEDKLKRLPFLRAVFCTDVEKK